MEPMPNDIEKYSNPGIRIYDQTHDWNGGWEPVSDTTPLKYAPEYLPTDTALDVLKEYSPIVDIGAGNGYWTEMINRAGGDCIAIEPDPELREHEWCHIEKGTHEVVKKYNDRNVLLCHPPGSLWIVDLLDYMNDDQTLIFVGEWWRGQDGLKDFFDKLRVQYYITNTFEVVNWKTTTARGYVFESAGLAGAFSWGTQAISQHLENANQHTDDIDYEGFESIYDRKSHPYYSMLERNDEL